MLSASAPFPRSLFSLFPEHLLPEFWKLTTLGGRNQENLEWLCDLTVIISHCLFYRTGVMAPVMNVFRIAKRIK